MVDEVLQFAEIALASVLGQDRDERRRESALGEQAAEEIRDLERDEKGIGVGIRTEDLGENQVANEAQDPRQKGMTTDGR